MTPDVPAIGSGGPYAFFGGQGVSAVDLSAPSATPAAVHVGGNGGLSLVHRGTYDAATGSIHGLVPHAVVWISGGRIYRERADAGPLEAPAQVSSVSTIGDPSPSRVTATHLCDAYTATDWARPDASQYLYTLAGSDRDCGTVDDVRYAVRLDTPPTSAPVRVDARPVTEILDPTTGAITGWLAIDAGYNLVRTDPAFGAAVVVSAGEVGARLVGRNATHQYLALGAGGATVGVHRFDLAAGTLDPAPVLTVSGPVDTWASDGTDLYLSVYELNGSSAVWRLPLAATAAGAGVQLSSEPTGARIWSALHLTATRVVYVVRDAASVHHLVALDKTSAGTRPGAELVAAPAAGTSLELLATAADRIYFESVSTSGARSAFAVTSAGSPVLSEAAATWIGFVYPTARSAARAGEPEAGLLARGLSATGGTGGAVVRAVTLATGTSVGDLGTIPADLAKVDRGRLVGTKGLLCGHLADAHGDVLFVDAAVPGSLVRATSTPTVSESLPTWPDPARECRHPDLGPRGGRASATRARQPLADTAPRSGTAPALGSPVAIQPRRVVARIAYVLANPVAAGLVERGADWPGLWTSPEQIGAATLTARTPARFFDPKGYLPETVELEVVLPPGFASAAEFRSQLTAALDDLEEQHRRELASEGRRVLGAALVRAQSPFAAPSPGEPRFRLSPRIAARDKWKRMEGLQRLGTFERQYWETRVRWQAGFRDVLFPAGTYLLRLLHGAQCAGAA